MERRPNAGPAALLVVTRIAIACALAGVVASPPRALAGPEAPYRVYTTDGGILLSWRRPTTMLGKILIVSVDGKATWIDAGNLDLARSRAEWSETDARNRLDRHPLQGKPFPDLSAERLDGTRLGPPARGNRGAIVNVWAGY